MNLRKIITILILVVALVIAGIFAYKTFADPTPKTDDKSTTAAVKPTGTTKANTGANSSILPLGTKLDFEIVKKFNPTGRLFPYPTVRQEEAGKILNEVVTQ